MKTKLILTAVLSVAIGATAGWLAPHPSGANVVATAPLADTVPGTTNAVPAEDGKILYYVCPMHPKIHYNHPGDCPICGMKLVPVYASEATNTAPVDPPSCCGGGNS